MHPPGRFTMGLTPGTRLGPYEVTAQIGVGGMGEVYRATDTKLKREVAIKVLPPSLAGDPNRLARFQREAEVLASLNHPNIAAIYGLEEGPAEAGHYVRALVMELVEGPTLAERISHAGRVPRSGPAGEAGSTGAPHRARVRGGDPAGPGLPVDETLAIAKQIAEALEAAHERGIIHRDLKPANVKVRPDGMVKVLDFGLAKLHPNVSSGPNDPNASQSPTITTPAMTQMGMILGTAAYMSPEQARGKDVDKRADVWAFGAVLFEMLTGSPPFPGDDISQVLARVIDRDPDWSALPPTLSPVLRAYLQRCLVKDPRQRIRDIGDVRLALDGAFDDVGRVPQSTAAVDEVGRVPRSGPAGGAGSAGAIDADPAYVQSMLARSTRRRVALVGTATLLAGAVVAATLTWFATRPPELEPPRVSRLPIAFSPAAALTINGLDRDLAITPDGSRLVYAGNHGTQLFVRALDALEPVAVFTGAPHGPFVSPDGQWIGFMDGLSSLKKVAVTGGPAVTLATLDGGSRGATWGPEDTIIVATFSATTGLQRVAAAGGPTTVLTRPDRAQGEADHLWPELLPGGRAVLFTITAVTGGLEAAQVAVLDLQTGTHRVLVRGGSHAHYVQAGEGDRGLGSPKPGEGGYLVYAAAGTLRAVPFDLARLETRGTPVPVVPAVVTSPFGAVDAVVAGDGTLAYVSGVSTGASRTLVWVDRQGRETPIPAPPRAYLYPRLSPDGTRVAVSAADQELDIWVWDLGRTTLDRATFDPGFDAYPVWTPDGRRVIFTSERAGGRNLFWQAADGTGTVERLSESPNAQNASAASPDGRLLIFTETAPKTIEDVMQMALDGTHSVTPLVQSPFAERNGVVSPDGRWLAYEANDSGRVEISVRPFPDVNSGRWQVSTAGGTRPLWVRSGQELFYVAPTGALMRVGVERSPSWAATTPTLLVKEGYFTSPGGQPGRTYDISPDGQRFLMIKEGGGADQTAAPPSLIVVQHWVEELKRLVPGN